MKKRNIEKLKYTLNVPVKIFNDRRLGVLESLVLYLQQIYKFRNCEIAKLLNRDDRTIYTVLKRANEKIGDKK